jgi:protein-disulfide isomerase
MYNFKKSTSNYFTGVLVFFAFVITALVIRQEFFLSEPQKEKKQLKNANYLLKNWQQLKLKDQLQVSEDSSVQILEFLDYQCPSCKRMQPVLHFIEQKYGDKISVTYIHVPLDYHKFAFKAAVAAECAGRQGSFASYHDALFANQDQLGWLSYDSLATQVNIENHFAFMQCLENEETAGIVKSGKNLAKELDVRSIPTFIINDKMVSGALSEQRLERLVKDALAEAGN